jgi:hypothetical protein
MKEFIRSMCFILVSGILAGKGIIPMPLHFVIVVAVLIWQNYDYTIQHRTRIRAMTAILDNLIEKLKKQREEVETTLEAEQKANAKPNETDQSTIK